MATLTAHKNFEIRDNLDTIVGVTLTWRMTSEPPVDGDVYEDERNARGLGREFRCTPLSASAIFARECRAATFSYTDENGASRKITALPMHKDDDAWTNSFVIGRKGTRKGAEAIHIGRVSIDLATDEVSWEFTGLDRNLGEDDAAYIERRRDTLPIELTNEDVKRFTGVAGSLREKVRRFTGKLDVNQYRATITSVLSKLPTFHISHGSWFVPSDTTLGSDNPVLVAEQLKELIETVNPANRIYLIPVFPSADSVQAAVDGATESIDTKIAELEIKLEEITFSRSDAPERWTQRWDEVEAEAKLYSRLLGMQIETFQQKIDAAREAIDKKAAELDAEREARDSASSSKRAERSERRQRMLAALEAAAEGGKVQTIDLPSNSVHRMREFTAGLLAAGKLDGTCLGNSFSAEVTEEALVAKIHSGPASPAEVSEALPSRFTAALREALTPATDDGASETPEADTGEHASSALDELTAPATEAHDPAELDTVPGVFGMPKVTQKSCRDYARELLTAGKLEADFPGGSVTGWVEDDKLFATVHHSAGDTTVGPAASRTAFADQLRAAIAEA